MTGADLAGAELDVAVIGCGLVGSAIARGLARVGQRVAVLDEGDVAHRASRGNFALEWVQSKGWGMPEYAGWTRRSSGAWGGFAVVAPDGGEVRAVEVVLAAGIANATLEQIPIILVRSPRR